MALWKIALIFQPLHNESERVHRGRLKCQRKGMSSVEMEGKRKVWNDTRVYSQFACIISVTFHLCYLIYWRNSSLWRLYATSSPPYDARDLSSRFTTLSTSSIDTFGINGGKVNPYVTKRSAIRRQQRDQRQYRYKCYIRYILNEWKERRPNLAERE